MDRKSKLLIGGFILIFIVVSLWGYYKFFVNKDFIIHSYAECDPQIEACFVWCEEGECEEDYYSKITKNASNITVCNEILEECEPLVCEQGEKDCEITYCSADTIDEGEICTNPIDFQVEILELESTSTESII